jgi:hypothetical protein
MNYTNLKRLLKYSDRYEISIQFWPQQVAVYIAKDGVDLNSWGCYDGSKSITSAIEYLDRINKKQTI